ncbi:hypothetical protein OBBRIDRAFT_323480 [Obba rivulosa]|uniref:Uncharacterized protein n=1 Tax=Obba rivulosa TaxID=1052685 RepID=A0A8E2AIS9_9APHY|nr:hypothetical protein OBBRIDRAFT_323480 [Obba rivulosa]
MWNGRDTFACLIIILLILLLSTTRFDYTRNMTLRTSGAVSWFESSTALHLISIGARTPRSVQERNALSRSIFAASQRAFNHIAPYGYTYLSNLVEPVSAL